MSKPVLYGPTYSTYTRSARMAMEEKGVKYDLVDVDLMKGQMPPEQMQRHPFGRVPAFEHDGFKLYETAAITRYIDETFDGPALQPKDAKGRARMNQILSIIDCYAYPCTISQLVIQRIVMPMMGEKANETVIKKALPEVAKCMVEFDRLRGKSKYLVGDSLTLADIHLAPVYEYFHNTPDSEAIRRDVPGLDKWWKEMSTRSSMRRTPFSGEKKTAA